MIVDAELLLQEVRARSGLSRRKLAALGGTSASTLGAYESGKSVPSVRTLERLVRSAGFELLAALHPALPMSDVRREESIERLFDLTDQLPRRRRGALTYPRFPTAPRR